MGGYPHAADSRRPYAPNRPAPSADMAEISTAGSRRQDVFARAWAAQNDLVKSPKIRREILQGQVVGRGPKGDLLSPFPIPYLPGARAAWSPPARGERNRHGASQRTRQRQGATGRNRRGRRPNPDFVKWLLASARQAKRVEQLIIRVHGASGGGAAYLWLFIMLGRWP